MVAMHWGNEYQQTASTKQKEQAAYLASLDVDIVLGTHSHCIQPWEMIDDTVVFYSFGNFLSNQMAADSSLIRKVGVVGMFATLDITKVVDTEKDTTTITIDNIGDDLNYSYKFYNKEKGKHDYKVIPFSKMESKYLNNYEKVYNEYNQIYQDSNYELMKINYIPSIITMVITILYFVVFGYFCNGQTLGKKMMQLQVVSKDDKRVNILKLLLRTVILAGILTSILNLILLFSVNKEVYFVAEEYIGIVSGIIEMIILVMVLYRKDKRGLHDMISGTKVIDLKIINSSNVIEAEIVKEIEQKEKDKVDEEQERLRARFK